MTVKKRILVLAVALAAFAPQARAAETIRSLSYYTVNGRTAAELDRALAHSGPVLQKNGAHHPGAARLRFDAKVRYGRAPGQACRVQGVRVNVYAKVSLPRWRQRAKASPELALVWDTLVSDIRRHEESHIVIARSHASEMEREIRALRSRPDCALLKADIDKVGARILADHDKAQLDFDRVETLNFEDRFTRLLTYRLERMKKEGR